MKWLKELKHRFLLWWSPAYRYRYAIRIAGEAMIEGFMRGFFRTSNISFALIDGDSFNLFPKEVNMPESDLIAACIQLITLKGGVAVRVNSGMMVIKDEQGNKTRIFKGAGKGTSDILACYRGYFLAIECKMPKNKPTEAQEAFLASIGEAGGIGIVIWDINTLETLLEKLDKLFPFLDKLISRDEVYRREGIKP